MGKAVVCTPQSLEGIRAPQDSAVRVADDAADFAARVVELLRAPESAAAIGAAARRCMEQEYSWEANLRPLDRLLATVSPRAALAAGAAS
jgi:hypothetical protein